MRAEHKAQLDVILHLVDRGRRKALEQYLDMGYGHLQDQIEFWEEVQALLEIMRDAP